MSFYWLLMFIAESRTAGQSYPRQPEIPLYDGSFARPDPPVVIVNVCLSGVGLCRSLCGGEPWGKRWATVLCREFLGESEVVALNSTLPEKLSRWSRRAVLTCPTSTSSYCNITGITGNCTSGRVAAVNCSVKGSSVILSAWSSFLTPLVCLYMFLQFAWVRHEQFCMGVSREFLSSCE